MKTHQKYPVKEGCPKTCYLKCSEIITEEERLQINQKYWDLDFERQKGYIFERVTKLKPKRMKDKSSKKLTDEDQTMLKDLKSKEKSPGPNVQLFDEDFTIKELETAMKMLKSRKSPGPDGIHNEMLTHLGNIGKKVILNLINKTWTTGELHNSWKIAIIMPLLKKGKPA